MKSYRQHCGLAKALDVVGDRWTLLLIRELLIRGACRYTDLRQGLPGIASNLLAVRLRELEKAGVLISEEAPPPVARKLFRLTKRGEALAPVVEALGRWGAPLLSPPNRRDAFRSHWLVLPAEMHLKDHAPEKPPVGIELRIGDEPLTIETADGRVRARPGPAEAPALILSGRHDLVLGVLMRKIGFAEARAAGMSHHGDPAVLTRVHP